MTEWGGRFDEPFHDPLSRFLADYECPSCGHHFDATGGSDCPSCAYIPDIKAEARALMTKPITGREILMGAEDIQDAEGIA